MKMFELTGAALALVLTSIVAYTDYKTGYMPDRYTHSMIVLGALILPFYQGFSAALPYYAIAALVFGVSFLFYIFGQLGGGDVKLFTGMSLLIPTYPLTLKSFGFNPVIAPYPFIISVFFLAAVLAMIFVSGNYLAKLYKDRKRVKDFNAKSLKGLLYAVMTLPLTILWAFMNPNMAIIGLPLAIGAFALAFKTDILRLYVVKKKLVSKLNDDDVVALELLSKSMKKKLGLGSRKTFLEMELKDLKKRAKKAGVKEILVQEYLPKFGPYILAALILNLIVGDALLWLLLA